MTAAASPAPPGRTTLRLERPSPGVALLTLDRPERLNALTFASFDDIHAACAELAADRSVRAAVVTGAGRGFCAGLDLGEGAALAGMPADELVLMLDHLAGAFVALHELPQPVIAAVNGVAAGGGLGIALAADVRIAARSARFNAAFVRIGLSGGDVGVSWLLPRVVGLGRAAELLLTGRFVDSAEAAEIGLVNEVVADEDVLGSALAQAERIAALEPVATTMTKRALHAHVAAPTLRAAVESESRGQALVMRSPGFPAALAAFRDQGGR